MSENFNSFSLFSIIQYNNRPIVLLKFFLKMSKNSLPTSFATMTNQTFLFKNKLITICEIILSQNLQFYSKTFSNHDNSLLCVNNRIQHHIITRFSVKI